MHNNNIGPGMSDSESHARKLFSLKMKNNKQTVEAKTHHQVQPGHPQTEETPPAADVRHKSKQMAQPSIAGALASLHSIWQEEQMEGNYCCASIL